MGTKSPNELGIYDMSGNVWEWCNDWYDSSYYSYSPQVNPQGPSSGTYHVLRGSSCCMSRVWLSRVAFRSWVDTPDWTPQHIGFRFAKSIDK